MGSDSDGNSGGDDPDPSKPYKPNKTSRMTKKAIRDSKKRHALQYEESSSQEKNEKRDKPSKKSRICKSSSKKKTKTSRSSSPTGSSSCSESNDLNVTKISSKDSLQRSDNKLYSSQTFTMKKTRSRSNESLHSSLPHRFREMSKEDEEFLHREAELARSFCEKECAFVVEDAAELVQHLEQAYNYVSESFNKPNVLVTGITGSGKSTLINSMFGKEVAATGTGVPITQHFTKYDSPDTSTVIYDSKGLEHGYYQDFIESTNAFFEEHQIGSDGHSKDAIHVVWYIVNTAHARFEPFEQELCMKLFSRTPIFFLLNKADISTEEDRAKLRQIINDMNLPNCCGILDVIACPTRKLKSCDRCSKCSSDDVVEKRKCGIMICGDCGHRETLVMDNGLEGVVKASLHVLPEIVKDNFIAAQNVSLCLKEDLSREVLTEFWEDFGRSQTYKSLINTIARMMARLSMVWDFRGHGNQIGTLLAGDLVTCLNWRRKLNMLGQEKKMVPTEAQRHHLTSLGILWNLCLRELSHQLFSNWAERVSGCDSTKSASTNGSVRGRKRNKSDINSTCSHLFNCVFSAMNEKNLKSIEIELLSTNVNDLLGPGRLRYEAQQVLVVHF